MKVSQYNREAAKKLCELDKKNFRTAYDICNVLKDVVKTYDGKCFNKTITRRIEQEIKDVFGERIYARKSIYNENCLEITFYPYENYVIDSCGSTLHSVNSNIYLIDMFELVDGKRIDFEIFTEQLNVSMGNFKRYCAEINEKLERIEEFYERRAELLTAIKEFNKEVGDKIDNYFELKIKQDGDRLK